jgi:putative DNA primase/helicase
MGGIGAWEKLAPPDDTSTEAEIKRRQRAWRNAHPQTVKFWGAINRTAIQAVRKPDIVIECGRLAFKSDGTFLHMKLPSGRKLAYPFPRLKANDRGDLAVVFMDNQQGKWTECRFGHGAYGGIWIENAVQAIARDLFAAAMLRLEAAGYRITLHVHDEIVAEVPDGIGSAEEFLRILTLSPDWADGLPIAAKVRNGKRFAKIEAPRANEPTSAQQSCTSSTPEPEIFQQSSQTIITETNEEPAPPDDPPPDDPPPRGNGGVGNSFAADDFSTRDRDGYPWGEREVGSKVAEFIYRDMKGAPYLKVVKRVTKQGKSYPQYHWGNGRWMTGKPNGPAIPYRLPELLAAPPGAAVWIPEGELCADILAALGLIATTNPGGAGKWTPELNKWLAGFPVAYVLEDNDAAGRDHVSKVATALNGTIPEIRVLTFRELREHGDVKNWIDAGGTLEQLLERAKQAPKFAALECVCAADEEMEALDWIWPGRFAIGKIGLLVGLPDEGKGLTLSDIMARITRGSPWPCDEGQAPLGNVVLLTAEDDINDTILPRLVAAGADLSRVTIVKMMHEAGKQRMFSLISDLDALRQKIVEVGDVKMILIDPITAYLGIGKIDSFRATDVRAVLGPLVEFAGELRVSILAIMHFNKKIDITNVLLRISDSLAYGATARHAYAIVDDPDNHRKLFVKGKNNLAPKDQKTLAFGFDEREVGTDKKTGAPIIAPHIVWHAEPVDITATEAMQAAAESKSPSARETAKRFLEALLSDGPVDAKDAIEAAEANGISVRTLKRARSELSIDVKKDGPIVDGERTWRWHLATKKERTQ